MNFFRVVVGTAVGGGMLVAGLGIGTLAGASMVDPANRSTPVVYSASGDADQSAAPQAMSFPSNAAGQTYGSAAGATWETIPDLVLVIMDDGREGYVARDLVFSPPPESLDSAMATGPVAGRINATAEDGRTVIGTFTLTAGSSGQG